MQLELLTTQGHHNVHENQLSTSHSNRLCTLNTEQANLQGGSNLFVQGAPLVAIVISRYTRWHY